MRKRLATGTAACNADSGGYGMKIINALGQVKQECGTAPWQTAI